MFFSKALLRALVGILVSLEFVYAQQRTIKPNGLYPSWSASGNRIAFSGNHHGHYDIFTISKDGTDIVRVTSFPGNEYWPSWIGDKFIVFDADIHGNEELYRIRTDGRQLVRLTFDTVAYDGVAAVSSRSHQIAFDSNREKDALADVWVMSPGGKHQTQVTQDPRSQGHPAWSPDEKRIAFKMKLSDSVHEIFSMHSDGSSVEQITFHGAISQHPSWSPDQKCIIYVSDFDGDFEVYSMELSSGKHVKLTDNSHTDYRPSYSPDGNYILFCARVDGAWQVRLLSLLTDEVTTLYPR